MIESLIKFECWVYGTHTDSLFFVDIPTTGTIADLKAAIKTNQTKFRHMDPNDLELYTIPSPADEHIENILSGWTFGGQLCVNSRPKVVSISGNLVLVRVRPAGTRFYYDTLHEVTHNIFPIDISITKTLGALKQAIKAERTDTFGNINAMSLRVYPVRNCTSENLEETVKEIDFDQLLPEVRLLSDIFTDTVVSGHIHAIVCGPSSDARTMPTPVGDDILTYLTERFNRITMNDGPTPSVAAKLFEYAKIQSGSQSILDCRCPARKPVNTVAPPIQLFHPTFAYFSSKAFDLTYAIPDHFVHEVRDLMARFTLIYDGENTRRQEIRPILSKAIGRFLSSITNSDKTSPDMAVLSSHRELPTYLVIGEEKNEFGDGGSDLSVQASFSFQRLFCQRENKELLQKCCCPAFLIAHARPWLSIMGGIVTSHCIVQRLTDFVWVPIHSTHDDGQFYRIARVLYALRESIQQLDSWYKGLDVAPWDLSPATFHCRFWPSSDTYWDGDTNTLVKFTYQKPLERNVSCVTYLARTLEEELKDIVVKFVTSYGANAHRHMASEGFAPRLLYYGGIDVTPEMKMPSYGDLRMVVMEHVKGSTLHQVLERKAQIPSTFKSDLERAFKHLHGAGYVFGDLRKPNVMVLPEGTPRSTAQLINFDWSGLEGKVKYPVSISTAISWASGVEGLANIEKKKT